MATTLEFAVKITCACDEKKVRNSLMNVEGVEQVQINSESKTVFVKSNLNAQTVLEKLNSTGLKSVLKGTAGSVAGVAILDGFNRKVQGVVRLMQVDTNNCIVEGTVDGLVPGDHKLVVHESGDISNGCDSVGGCYNISDNLTGELGLITADANGRATFRMQDRHLTLPDIIGRSLVISSQDSRDRFACGIIARSAGLFENPKTICACDGTTIWDENKKTSFAL